MKDKKLLVISNGFGEDMIGARILKDLLKTEKKIEVSVLPIVGHGKAYNSLKVELIGRSRILPGGGFSTRDNFKNLWTDLRAGLLSSIFSHIKTLHRIKDEIDLALVVGDISILLLAGIFTGKDIIFLPTAKSEYISGHYGIEKLLMRKLADVVIARDDKTAAVLKKADINARYVGNAMMDCFEIKGVDFSLKAEAAVGLLPGSRDDAYQNILAFLKVIENIEEKSPYLLDYLAAVAGSLSLDEIRSYIGNTDWIIEKPGARELNAGIKLIVKSPAAGSKLRLVYHHFGDVLVQSDVFIGLAGTANEQAAGLGKPVVTFPGEGSQFTEEFARDQKKLLGDSVALVENKPRQVAEKVLQILNDDNLYQRMSKAGRQRMGKPGAVQKIVDLMVDYMN